MAMNHLVKVKKNNEHADLIEKVNVNCYSLMKETILLNNISRLENLPKKSYLNCLILEHHRVKVMEVVKIIVVSYFNLIRIS